MKIVSLVAPLAVILGLILSDFKVQRRVSNLKEQTSSLKTEVCSYQCLCRDGRWPDRVEFHGRNQRGQAICRCFYASTRQVEETTSR